jgi:poly(A) polymerase
VKLKSGLKKISAERIRQELLKLLVAPRAVDTLKIMASSGILKTIIPCTDDWRVFKRLPLDPILRLYVLAQKPEQLKDVLRLSNEQALRLEALAAAPELSPQFRETEQRVLLYQMGVDAWVDAVHVSWAKSRAALGGSKWRAMLELPLHWPIPKFPVTGKDLIGAGLSAGPELGTILNELEDWWVASDFAPTRAELLQRIGHGN